MMTKKDFELIAKVISKFETPYSDLGFEAKTERMRIALADDFIAVLKKENPNFDKTRFMAACMVNNGSK